ncbi:hypothetical protein [Arthrobacter sp. ZGTC131]|uniref:TY-Chap2 family putative peptide chaperone n=1 Tax=Arthrobacter sp. ZGTC131 TaxID=2058898 RepID=UPI0011B09AFA|nr:hypothetical protein [Arthrobacter sp. ZGTC131]
MFSSIYENSLAAHSWWLAAEVARRHKSLRLISCVETLGLDETLGIFDANGRRLLAFISEVPNRAVVDGSSQPGWAMGWPELLAMTPREAVTAIERNLNIYLPNHALETTEETLVYRLMAKLIGLNIWSSDTWRAFSCCYFDAQDKYMIPSDALDDFPSALDKFESLHGRVASPPAAEGYWSVYKNKQQICVLDDDALLHFADNRPPMPLMQRFNEVGRNVDVLAASVMKVLPNSGV